ncbi:hypothetical protein, conserved [Eimeria necatrix]|uniref:Ubiquitin-like domain-containing protein n=1 Tax=Eimeria necatrix TaxID=51315 RepID=U6MT22_9EIME|nr:hypothetical protein, conserved [Eimeria necatrix]CDJ65589.1 hypothetical protein, conserved [Eimeria necatrix]
MDCVAKLKSFARVKTSEEKQMAHIKFIFSNCSQSPIDVSYDAEKTLQEVKADLLLLQWRQALGPSKELLRLRLFCCGREMLDSRRLRDYPVGPHRGAPTACHVFLVFRDSSSCSSSSSSSSSCNAHTARCMCTIA